MKRIFLVLTCGILLTAAEKPEVNPKPVPRARANSSQPRELKTSPARHTTKPVAIVARNESADLGAMKGPEQQKYLTQLPPAVRQKAESQVKALNQLPTSERQQVMERYERFKQMPPEQQQKIRLAYENFQKIPSGRQEAIRGVITQLHGLPPVELKKRLRTKEFKDQFSKEERKTLEDLLESPEE